MSVHRAVLDVITSRIAALGLTLGATPVSVGPARKTAEVREQLDAAPLIGIACHRLGGSRVHWDTARDTGQPRRYRVTYMVYVYIEVAGNRDPVTNLDVITDWRQAIFRTIADPVQLAAAGSFGSAEVWDIEHEPEGAFDPAASRSNWDSSPLTLGVVMIEPATGV